MMLEDIKILIVSPEPWNHIFVSKHHYAVHLAKLGNTVFFLNRPGNENAIKATEFENIFEVTIKQPVRGFRLWPSFLRRIYTKYLFNKIQKLCEVRFDLLWCFDHSLFFQLDALPATLIKISHIVDYTQDYNLPIGAGTANVCFTPNRFLLEKLQKYNTHSYFINHGYNLPENNFIPFQYDTGRKAVRVGYAGNLEIKYLDWDLIEQLAKSHPDIDFLMAGPVSESRIKELNSKYSNLYFVGILSSKQVQKFYLTCDILLLCYNAEEFLEQLSNPHKVLEYLGSGKVLLSTWVEEYKDLVSCECVVMPIDKQQIVPKLKSLATNLLYWNDSSHQERRKVIAIKNSYFNQIGLINKIINSFFKPA